ncbi:MAG: chemotaxis protein CheW [Beijerinckiaceae bacterium]|jgi:purine-binding chemotaxis protein CheW|nr:chemotaxis protein CheW [Beijerinckiaceae bacterium]
MSAEQRMRRDMSLVDEIQLVSVRIEGQLIGLPITSVRDVFSITAMTPVPKADRAVAGLVNLRGHIVTILDLGYLLNSRRAERQSAQEPMAVGVEWQGEVFGLVVDEIGDVLSLTGDSSEPMPANMGTNWARFTRRVHKLERELMIEIDLHALLETMSLQAA